ncbi:response regulator [Nostoc sp. XA010]|uniref:hybrid sensor histidine kinase/response regulator n=1 Tax=Nostoc sp. XA010 TaxID=2780407 RepID=UPI001E61BB24|nr:response regulator [Nostoc sp. XA010]MCC5661613.1 response regulator [Nostoc sp. XA010]
MNQNTRTILIIDDSAEDRELYRRYLIGERYIILEAALGKQGMELWQQHQPDAVLLDYRLPDLDGLKFLAQLQPSSQQSCLPIIIMAAYGNEASAVQAMKAGAQDYLVKEQITPEGLQLAVEKAIETVQLRTQLQQRIEKERLILQITQKIHQTLDLKEILQTAVTEVRQFLQTDRVLIFRLQPDGWGTVATESVDEGWTPLLSTSLYDSCFNENYVEPFRQGLVTIKPDIHDGSINPCHVELLASLQVRANLVVPILQDNQLWGMLIAHHCAAPRQWQALEIDLLKELATQVGIALQQAELYQQAQNELAERKQAEAERDHLLKQEQAARAEAERANRVKDDFLAILSHELRTPLNSILGWAKLMQMSKLDPPTTTQALASIERNAELQTKLIDDLLDVAKILRGKLSMNVAPVNLVFIIESAIDTVRTAALAKSILLRPVLSPVGQVSGDAARLQQIVWNLLSNAIKFTHMGGQVGIRLEQVGNQAQITVSDTGKGINCNFLPHIFESFRQEDASTTRKYGGLGLGLAIVCSLTEAHGGTICADSKGEGQGATFTVRLPLLNADPQRSQPDSLLEQEPELTGIRVLMVDDEPDTRELSTALLTQYGAEVLTVTSAAEALASLESFQPDVLVSDIGMPEMDGYALLQQVRSLPPSKGGQIPAIALTAYARVEDQQRAKSAGFQHHISKPLDVQRLVQTVSALAQQTYL